MENKRIELIVSQILTEVVNGSVEPQKINLLNDLICSENDVAEIYYEFVTLHALLKIKCEQTVLVEDTDEFQVNLLREAIEKDELQRQELEQLESQVRKEEFEVAAKFQLEKFLAQQKELENIESKQYYRRSISILSPVRNLNTYIKALAACMVIGLCVWFFMQPKPLQTVAKIIDSHQAQWSVHTENILQNKEYYLISGLAEIELDDGAKIILKGPSDIRLESSNEVALNYGKLSAIVSDSAKGFTVTTPTLSIIDYGTAFDVSVDENGISECHVFEGTVGIAAKANPNHYLKVHGGQARRVATDGASVVDIKVDPSVFMESLPPDPVSQETSQSHSEDHYEQLVQKYQPFYYERFNSLDGIDYQGQVQTATVQLALDGHSNQALEIKGSKSFAITKGFPLPVSSFRGKTVMFWFWIDQAYFRENWVDPTLLGVGLNENGSMTQVVQMYVTQNELACEFIALNNNKEETMYALAANQTWHSETWYHITISIDQENRARLFVNGQELASVDVPQSQTIVYWNQFFWGRGAEMLDQPANDANYSIKIDEFALFDQALTPEQIQDIYQAVHLN